MTIRKVTLIGLGAMGSYFAPKLEERLEKGNFRILADGERKRRLEEKGVTVNGVTRRFPVVSPREDDGPSDLVIIAVKYMALPQAIADIRNQVGPRTQILCILNGIDSEERVAAAYGWEHVLYSYMRVSIVMRDGVADFDPDAGSIHFGEARNGALTERVTAVRELFDACGIRCQTDEDMIRGMWFKFMCNVGENLTCALLGIPFGAYRVSENANAIRRGAMREVMQVANRLGIGLNDEDIARQEQTVKKLPFFNKPSTLQDVESGRKTEIDLFAGKMLELGEKTGVDTPLCRLFYHGIRVYEEKNAGMFSQEREPAL